MPFLVISSSSSERRTIAFPETGLVVEFNEDAIFNLVFNQDFYFVLLLGFPGRYLNANIGVRGSIDLCDSGLVIRKKKPIIIRDKEGS
jgi:hypothetical protein